jgi:hypothetical protein
LLRVAATIAPCKPKQLPALFPLQDCVFAQASGQGKTKRGEISQTNPVLAINLEEAKLFLDLRALLPKSWSKYQLQNHGPNSDM